MSNQFEKIRSISSQTIVAAAKRKRINQILKMSRLLPLGKGAWLGFRGKDTVSGLMVEGSASDTYISSFMLPLFDELRFVSWSLGRRVVHCSPDTSPENECERALVAYHTELLPVSSPSDIIKHLDAKGTDGFYPLWVKYICYARIGALEEAASYMTDDKISQLHISVLSKLSTINPLIITGDIIGVQEVLSKWECISRNIFGYGEFSL